MIINIKINNLILGHQLIISNHKDKKSNQIKKASQKNNNKIINMI